MAGRRRVVILDALLDGGAPGAIRVVDDMDELEQRQESTHQLTVAQTVALLRKTSPEMEQVRFQVVGISVESASLQGELSGPLRARMPEMVDWLIEELQGQR